MLARRIYFALFLIRLTAILLKTVKLSTTSRWRDKNLESAENAYDSLAKADSGEISSGVQTIATYGRATTIALQKLRSHVSGFDNWYSVYQDEMKSDPMMKRFADARNEALKEGKDPVEKIFYVNEINLNDNSDIVLPDSSGVIEKPDAAEHPVLRNDTLYWKYELLNDRELLQPFEVPEEVMLRDGIFKNQPETHLGRDVSGVSIRRQSRMYLDYLWGMVDDAEERFVEQDSSS